MSDARTDLLDRWRPLRESGRLGALLPGCTTRTIGEGAEAWGFETLDYCSYRDFVIPAGGPGGADATADLLEIYWSVRTKGGAQDPNWAAALNAHVVTIVPDPVTVGHLDRLYHAVGAIRMSLQSGGIGDLVAERVPLALHARGLLLSPARSESAAILEALATRADASLTVGYYERRDDGELGFSGSHAAEPVWKTSPPEAERLREVGDRLIRHARLFRTKGRLQVTLDEPRRRRGDPIDLEELLTPPRT